MKKLQDARGLVKQIAVCRTALLVRIARRAGEAVAGSGLVLIQK